MLVCSQLHWEYALKVINMNTKIKYVIIITIAIIGALVLPIVAAQNSNEYRAFVTNERVSPYLAHGVTTVPLIIEITYVPIYPGATYTMTAGYTIVQADLAQPTTLDTQIAHAVKQEGLNLGYDVTKVYMPSYNMKVV